MPRRIAQILVVALWVGAASALWVSVTWGRELQRTAPEIFLGAAPLVGRNFRDGWDWRFGWGLVGASIVAVGVVVIVAKGWFETARLRVVIVATSVAAGAFALLLALTDGTDGVLFGAADENEYLANLDIAPPAGEFVRTFVANIDEYTVHARGHPPGFIVLLKAMDSVGLHGAWPVAMLSLLSTILLPAGVLVAVWAVAGPDWMRRSAPFLIVAPYALWMMTSADAFYAAVGAWGVALLALAQARHGRSSFLLGAGGGLLLSLLLFMTYGGAMYLLLPATLVAAGWLSKLSGVSLAVGGALLAATAMTAVWFAAGFWWFNGASTTRDEYWEGTAQFRVWNYFIVANLAAALLAVGPATFAGLTKLRSRRMWVLVGGALSAIVAADLSQLSKAEVERIWLLFYPWLVIAGAALAAGPVRVSPVRVSPVRVSRLRVSDRPARAGWVGVQAASAIVLQAALVSKW